jgi:eukaryotic-like serine/threonine-protein kinase
VKTLIGSRVSHYEILERLQPGASGDVYKARDLRHDRLVELELLPPRPDLTAGDRERCLREARAAASLVLPNVRPVHEVGETAEGGLFLALALFPGETLKARLTRRPLPLAEAVDLAAQVAAGLAAAHQRGLVHGNLEPANIKISLEERVQVCGFGLAPLASGNPLYRSPEQLAGGTVDARSDIWSLGLLLCEMLGGAPEQVTRAVLQEFPASVAQLLPGLPPGLARILDRALAKAPAARYASIEELRADLLALETGLLQDDDATEHEGGAHQRPGSVPAVLTGRMVSHFRIAEPIGGGGMGVVYRAEDTRLGRTVALKFLAPELVRDPVAKARFLTEARAASALEHPNLCTILDVGETTEGLLFLAMPLYQGESLELRLARGPLPVSEAIDIATQTARGLAKAHQQGIVHRDIKPANLFLTNDGTVKVLDFGIAKLTSEVGPTRAGAFLGTPFYMAPEQTRGEAVDARADVWSLGAVLYQMLAGRQPFVGGTGAAVVHAVLHEEPQPLARVRPEVPRELERIVERMLARDPEKRYADAGEVLAELRKLQGLASTTLVQKPAAGRWRRIGLMATLGLALIAAAGLVGLLAWRRSRGEPGPQPSNFTRLTDYQGKETFPSLSPDGTFFVYVKSVEGHSHIFLQHPGGKPLNLTADSQADNTQPAFSPDGQQIAFRSARDGGGIFLMGVTGEAVRRLTDFGFNPSWSPDGKEIAVSTEGAFNPAARYSRSQIFLVDVGTGNRRSLGVADGVQPSWSPHGSRIAFWGFEQPGSHRYICTMPVVGGTPVKVVDDAYYNWSPVWSQDGKFLYFASNRGGSMNLWRVAMDERSGEVLGSPAPITTPSEWSALPSFSRDGYHMIYATDDSRSFVEEMPFDPIAGRVNGPPTLVFEGARSVYSCDFSPKDGTWAVLWSGSPQDDLLLVRRDGREMRQLTNDPARDRAPSWSPDGRNILFYSDRSGKYEAWTIRPDGSGLTQITRLPANNVYDPAWSPDGMQIAFTYAHLGTAIMNLSRPASSLRVLPKVDGNKILGVVSWSGDGKFLAGQLLPRDALPLPGIVLWSFSDNSYRYLTRAGGNPVFFHSGARILFTESPAVSLADVASREVRTLVSAPLHSFYVKASVGPSDSTLCTVRTTNEGDIWMLSLFHSSPSS